MEFRCFNGVRNCDYCGSCHSEFKARTSDEKRRIYNQALEDVLSVVEWDGYTLDIKERIEQLKK